MVVVNDGAAARVSGGSAAPHMEGEGEEDEEPEAAEAERFSSLEKKIRALEKKKKAVADLKRQMRRGFELDAQQQARPAEGMRAP